MTTRGSFSPEAEAQKATESLACSFPVVVAATLWEPMSSYVELCGESRRMAISSILKIDAGLTSRSLRLHLLKNDSISSKASRAIGRPVVVTRLGKISNLLL